MFTDNKYIIYPCSQAELLRVDASTGGSDASRRQGIRFRLLWEIMIDVEDRWVRQETMMIRTGK